MAGTVIGEGLLIEGELSGEDEVVIYGGLRGRLTTTDAVTVSGTASVGADITAASLSVAGQVTGNVVASERVDIQAGGKLVGDVKAARFTIADGASFKGNVDMEM